MDGAGSIMEEIGVMLAVPLLMAAAIAPILYLALVIAVPIWRLLDWLQNRMQDAGKSREPKEWPGERQR